MNDETAEEFAFLKALVHWRQIAREAKIAAKSAGRINGDADIAAAISEILRASGRPEVDRGAVNHWLTGKRDISLAQYLALCRVLSIDPAEAINVETTSTKPS